MYYNPAWGSSLTVERMVVVRSFVVVVLIVVVASMKCLERLK